MESKKTLDKRFQQTRRFSGRRGLTPMKSKHKKVVSKTRGHRVEKRPYVPLSKHTSSQNQGEWQGEDKKEYSEYPQREGHQDSIDKGEWKDAEEHTQIEPIRDTENSEKSIHPGPVQTLCGLPEQHADYTQADKTEIEAEELPPG